MTVVHVFCLQCRETALASVLDEDPEPPIERAQCQCQRYRQVSVLDPDPDHLVRPVSHLDADEFELWDGAVDHALEWTGEKELSGVAGPWPYTSRYTRMTSFTDVLFDDLDGMLASTIHRALRENGPTVEEAKHPGGAGHEKRPDNQSGLARWSNADD